jgi:hypothetical protein
MDENSYSRLDLPPLRQIPPRPSVWEKVKKALVPLGIAVLLVVKFFGKLKFLVLPLLKFIPFLLKTGGSMLLMIWLYAMSWGWWFALGFVLLILVHECGHLVAAKRVAH